MQHVFFWIKRQMAWLTTITTTTAAAATAPTPPPPRWMCKAHDLLADPERRELYDRFGIQAMPTSTANW